jgi:hypothetical protein
MLVLFMWVSKLVVFASDTQARLSLQARFAFAVLFFLNLGNISSGDSNYPSRS